MSAKREYGCCMFFSGSKKVHAETSRFILLLLIIFFLFFLSLINMDIYGNWGLILFPTSKIAYPFGLQEERVELGKITFPLGDIFIQREGNAEWIQVTLNMSVYMGDKIKTMEESRCEVTLRDGSVIRIGENSIFDFSKSSLEKGRRKIKGEMKEGKIWFYIKGLVGEQESVEVRTPTAVAAIRGTVYRINALPDSTTQLLVYEGEVDINLSERLKKKVIPEEEGFKPPVEIEGPQEIPGPYEVTLEKWMKIIAGEQINIRADGKYHKFRFNEEEDARINWVKWNRLRDRMIKR
ncbi:MAG: FecR domain-containing protein [Fidelibacterota bacterium]